MRLNSCRRGFVRDNWMIHVAIERRKPGDVLVVGRSNDNIDRMAGDRLLTLPNAWPRHAQYGRAAGEGRAGLFQ
jgi:hypothetical protein